MFVSIRDRSDYGSLVEQSGARGFVTKDGLSGTVLERLLESQQRLVEKTYAECDYGC